MSYGIKLHISGDFAKRMRTKATFGTTPGQYKEFKSLSN